MVVLRETGGLERYPGRFRVADRVQDGLRCAAFAQEGVYPGQQRSFEHLVGVAGGRAEPPQDSEAVDRLMGDQFGRGRAGNSQ